MLNVTKKFLYIILTHQNFTFALAYFQSHLMQHEVIQEE